MTKHTEASANAGAFATPAFIVGNGEGQYVAMCHGDGWGTDAMESYGEAKQARDAHNAAEHAEKAGE